MSQEEQQKQIDDAWAEVSAAISAPEVELLELLIKDDSGDPNDGIEYLFDTAVHQGTLYDITLPVLRFCVRMLDQFSPKATEWVVVWIQLVGSIIRDVPEDPYAIQLHKENASVVEALLALDAKKGGEYYTRALGAWAWYFNAEDELAYRVRARLRECPVDGGTIAALGAWGGDTSNYLTSDDLGVRTAAAFHDRSEAGTAVLIEVLSDPKTEEVWEQNIEPDGQIDDVVEELVARDLSGIAEAERTRLESLPVFCLSIYYQPWKPFLQLINIGNGNGVLNTEATARFLGAVVDDDSLWYNENPYTTDALKKAGLPADRGELRKLVKSMRD
ncbi:hypothetical protein [Corynebacterium durum]|uniref:hypothetical protein n=1 Tax=Corynebacterium durum TaxID=61592 RepID=UPI0028F0E878|nr:hypothetical protein [Corynebacterium durum]